MSRRKRICSHSHCGEPAAILGLCEQHYKEHQDRQRLNADAVYLLHSSTVDGRYLEKPGAVDELRKLQGWWRRVCDALEYKRKDPILQDEAEFAQCWCESLASHLVIEERENRGEVVTVRMRFSRKDDLWELFEHLEAGRRSNGSPR